MLDFVLLILFLIFVFRIVASGLQKQPGGGGTSGSAMGDHDNVVVINTVQEWEAKLEEAKTARKVVVVDFTATWCGPCRHMAPIFAELSRKYSDLIFVKVDVDQLQEVAAKWDVQAMPTFVFIKDKNLVHKIVGANKDELEKKSIFFSASTHT